MQVHQVLIFTRFVWNFLFDSKYKGAGGFYEILCLVAIEKPRFSASSISFQINNPFTVDYYIIAVECEWGGGGKANIEHNH